MKFLTIAAVCALASSAVFMKLSYQLRADQTHQGKPEWAGQEKPQSAGQGKPSGAGQGKPEDKGNNEKINWSNFTTPCANKDDTACWQTWFSSQLNCTAGDNKCWGDSLKKLPCPLQAQKCWTDNIATFPCKEGDSACWEKILPTTLPCKQGDQKCWNGLRKDDKNGKK